MASHIAEVVIRKKIAAKSDGYYSDTSAFGETASKAFGNRNKAQIRNLENIANSATRVADILDFVKMQTGRSVANQKWRYADFGDRLLTKLGKDLRNDAEFIVSAVQRELTDHQFDPDDQRRIHILLCREFIRHLAAHYLYASSVEKRLEEQKNQQPDEAEAVGAETTT